jgi:NAD(P)-dependent dehydrogenase (short-subunit alcohol dehydrogenase family)
MEQPVCPFFMSAGVVGVEASLRFKNKGHKITALIREGQRHPKAKRLVDAGIDVMEGDLTPPETLGDAVQSIEVRLRPWNLPLFSDQHSEPP